jgi:dUTP pyrophosphatase
MQIKIINRSGNPMPEYKTSGSAGVDISAHLDSPVILKPLERQLIPTGLFIELPEGYEAQIRPRSGLAIQHGITCLNTPGTIDSDYRGEIKVILINLSDREFTIRNGDRIAQMVIARHERVQFVETEGLQATARGAGGFGHTGM